MSCKFLNACKPWHFAMFSGRYKNHLTTTGNARSDWSARTHCDWRRHFLSGTATTTRTPGRWETNQTLLWPSKDRTMHAAVCLLCLIHEKHCIYVSVCVHVSTHHTQCNHSTHSVMLHLEVLKQPRHFRSWTIKAPSMRHVDAGLPMLPSLLKTIGT